MTSVITGDVIKSGALSNPEVWLNPLKKAFKNIPVQEKYWEIYRGDSFQVEVKDISEAFIVSTYIKASVKTIKGLDVRMAIGIGTKTFEGKSITESNGQAYQFSGATLEQLKKEKTNLMIKTKDAWFDKEVNLYFRLAGIAMDNWTINSAESVKLFLETPNKTQEKVAKKLGISQDALSKRLKRAHFDKIIELDLIFRLKLHDSLK
jgi:hypothetical protein